MRESFAVAGARLVNRTVVPIQKLAALRITTEDQGVVFVAGRVFFEEGLFRKAQKMGQRLDVALDDLDFGNTAAFGALPAIDGVGNLFRGFAKLAADPAIFVTVADDPAVRPAGHEAWFVLVNAAPHGAVDWTRPGSLVVTSTWTDSTRPLPAANPGGNALSRSW